MIVLAALLPFASKTPDGLETLTQDSENQQALLWKGLMAGYSTAIADPYVSTLVAGLFGTSIVLAAGFALGVAVSQKKKP
jgi:hypothetical protein